MRASSGAEFVAPLKRVYKNFMKFSLAFLFVKVIWKNAMDWRYMQSPLEVDASFHPLQQISLIFWNIANSCTTFVKGN